MAIERYKLVRKHSIDISISAGVVVFLLALLILGIPTDVIENKWYMRMVPATALDVFFLTYISLMLGAYVGLASYIGLTKRKRKVASKSAFTGTIAGFFAIVCPTCISFLVAIFGSTFLMTYFDPLRPYLGILSLGLLGLGVYYNVQVIRGKCDGCKTKKG